MFSFRLTTIFYVMALLGVALTAFGVWGLLAAAIVLAVWIVVRAKQWPGLAGLAILALPYFLLALLPLLDDSFSPNYRNDCHAHLWDIAIALENYHATYGSFPPLYIADANGVPMHSWRVLILPFMESQSLYNAYNFNEPWNGPNNRKLADQAPFYCCSGIPGDEMVGCTTFFAVVGETAAWRNDRPRTLSEFTDDPSQTILVIECSGKTANWMEPVDLSYEEAFKQLTTKTFGGHRQGHTHFSDCQAAMADGSSKTVWPYERPETAKALLTISGGNYIEKKDIHRRVEGGTISKVPPAYERYIPIALFIALAIFPAFRPNRPRSRIPFPPRGSSPS